MDRDGGQWGWLWWSVGIKMVVSTSLWPVNMMLVIHAKYRCVPFPKTFYS